jgi:MT0933-like antitoxin protein
MSLLDKVKGILGKNIQKVEQVVDKAGDLVDERTGGKFKGAVDKVQDAAKNAAGRITKDDKDDKDKPSA